MTELRKSPHPHDSGWSSGDPGAHVSRTGNVTRLALGLSFYQMAHLGISWPPHSEQRCPESTHSKEGAREGWPRASIPSLAFYALAHL